MQSGIYDMSADDYHAGNGDDVPRLSASIANVLCTRSPLHAWYCHPKLNPDYAPVEDTKFDIGRVAHAILLDGRAIEDVVFVVHEPDWRKNVAQEQREYARAMGRVPLLAKHRDDVMRMVDAVRAQLATHRANPRPFTDGAPEQTLLWEERGALCKARLDWLRGDLLAIDDLKTTTKSASPAAYSRALFNVGGDVQAAFYLRGLKALTGAEDVQFRWIVVETSPPHAMSVISPDPGILALGQSKVEMAMKKWRACMATNEWPGYTREVAYAEAPGYEEARWLERELVDAA